MTTSYRDGAAGHVAGSETSQQAAESIMPSANTLRRLVLDAIRSSPVGLSCDEAEALLNLSHQTVSARICELHRHPHHGGWIEPMVTPNGKPVRRPTRSGRNATVYRAVPIDT